MLFCLLHCNCVLNSNLYNGLSINDKQSVLANELLLNALYFLSSANNYLIEVLYTESGVYVCLLKYPCLCAVLVNYQFS